MNLMYLMYMMQNPYNNYSVCFKPIYECIPVAALDLGCIFCVLIYGLEQCALVYCFMNCISQLFLSVFFQ